MVRLRSNAFLGLLSLILFLPLWAHAGIAYDWGFFSQSLKVGGSTPSAAASSALELNSTTKGFLTPRMTEAQRDAISSPANGLMVYNTDDLEFNYWNGTAWVGIGSNSAFAQVLMDGQASAPSAPSAGFFSLYVKDSDGKLYIKNSSNVETAVGSGDVIGPASSTDNALALFDSTTGKLLKNSTATLSSNNLTVTGTATATQFVGSNQSSTPTAPASGYTSIYARTVPNEAFYQTSGGFERKLSTFNGIPVINIFEKYNPDFETNTVTGWSETGGGTLAVESTFANVHNGLRSLSYDASTSGDSLDTLQIGIPAGLYGKPCELFMPYKGFDTNATAKVTDGTNVIAQETLTASTGWRDFSLNFTCPTSGNIAFKLDFTGNGAIGYIDDFHLGSATNVFKTAQAQFVGSIKYAGITNCAWATTSTSFGNYSADTDCNTPTVVGSVSAPATKIPGLVLPSTRAGTYKFIGTGGFYKGGAQDAAVSFRFSDGTNVSSSQRLYHVTAAGVTPVIEGQITYSTNQTNVTVQIQGLTFNASNSAQVLADATNADFQIDVYFYPATADIVTSAAADNWRVDANISGGNITLGNVDQTSYIGMESSALTLTNATSNNVNILPAMIPCSSTNPPTGTTCSAGNESNGVSFTIPKAQDVKACVAFSHNINNTTGTNAEATFQIIETPNNAQTISQEGKSRTQSINLVASTNVTMPHNLCGTFSFASAGQKTLRLMYEQDVTGTPTANQVLADALSSVGQRDIHWTVEPIDTVNGRTSLGLPTVSKVTTSTNSGGFGAAASGTYTTPVGVRYIRVRMVGAGGGGGGGGTASGTAGGAGGNTTFGSSLLVANGGGGGSARTQSSPPSGGTASLGTGPIGLAQDGANGTNGSGATTGSVFGVGGNGGVSPFGGAGGGGIGVDAGIAAKTASGSGGGGGGGQAVNGALGGTGGAAGGYVDAIINNPAASYAFAVGAAGTAGTAGTSGTAGAAGGGGQIIVEEYY